MRTLGWRYVVEDLDSGEFWIYLSFGQACHAVIGHWYMSNPQLAEEQYRLGLCQVRPLERESPGTVAV